MGCAQGALPVRVALTHPHLRGTGFDLPVVEPIFSDYVKSFGLDDRLRFVGGDFLNGTIPSADVGALIVYGAMTAPGRPLNRFHSLLSSLNIMLEIREGYESTTADCADMLRANGFGRVRVRHLIGPTSWCSDSSTDPPRPGWIMLHTRGRLLPT